MSYEVVKALHLIFMVTFFAGTFYIVRLFIYHREAMDKVEPERSILVKQLSIMERKLWHFITWPSIVLMTFFGLWLLLTNRVLLTQPWMHAKLGLIALLWVYHFTNQSLFQRIQQGQLTWSSFRLRLWNEGATLFLVTIVLLAVIKQLDWKWGVVGLLVLGGVLGMAVMAYRKRHANNGNG